MVRQPTTTSVILKSTDSGKEINSGRPIPLDQIIAGPVRAQISFDQEKNEVRAISTMLTSDAAPTGDTADVTERVTGAGRRR